MSSVLLQHDWLPYLIVALAVWRVSHALMFEVGPWRMLTNVRSWFGVRHNDDGTVLAVSDDNVFSCFWCFSIWAGIWLALLPWWVSAPFALSALAIFIQLRLPDGKS